MLLTGQLDLRRPRIGRYFILHADLAPHRWIVVMPPGLPLRVGKRRQPIVGLTTFAIAFSTTLALSWPTVDASIVPSEELRRVLQ